MSSPKEKASVVNVSSGDGATFTPGPWTLEVGDHTHRYVRVEGDDEQTIHYFYNTNSGRIGQEIANARLIAAAPTMAGYIAKHAAEGDPEAAQIMEAVHGRR